MSILERIETIWNFRLFRVGPDADPITVGQLLLVFLVLIVGYFASRLLERIVKRRLEKTALRADAAYAVQRIAFYLLLVIVAMTALSLLHIPLTAFAFISGAIAIGVGFGAQNIINNFISGWILMLERPVRIDDFIEIDNWAGVVERVGNRSTRIRRTDGVHLLVPNSQMLERVVVNWTLIDNRIRSMVRVGVAYGSPARRVAELMREAVADNPRVMQTPEPIVVFEDFGDSALIFDLYFWAELTNQREQRQVRSDIRMRIDELFRENDIVIAFPQRDLHLNTIAPLDVRVLDDDGSRESA